MTAREKTLDRPRVPRLVLGDAALDLLSRDAHVQRAVVWVASGVLALVAGAPEGLLELWICAVLPAALSITAVQALQADSGKSRDRFEERFWRDLQIAAVLFGAAVAANLPGLWWSSSVPPLLGRILLLAAYASLLQASEMQPHREGFWRSESLERRLSMLTVGLLGLGLFGYFAVVPAMISDRPIDAAGPGAYLFTVLTTLVGLRFLNLGFTTEELGWRTIYRALALGAFAFALFHGLGASAETAGALPDLPRLLLAGAGFALWVIAARLRRYPFPADWKPRRPDREPAADPVEESRLGLDFRTLVLALAVPFFHFVGTDTGILDPAYQDVREIWMLLWTCGLGALAFAQQTLSAHRLLAILTEQRRIQKTLAAGERRLQMVEERKETDEALYYSREKYAKAFRSGPYALGTLRLDDGRILEANAELLGMLSLGPTELARVRFPDLLPEDGPPWDEIRGRLGSGSARGLELRLLDLRGRERRIAVSAEPVPVSDEQHCVVICSDLTRREDLARRASLQRDLLERCGDPAWVVDASGRFLFANAAASALSGGLEEGAGLEDLFADGPELTAAELATGEGRNFMGRLHARCGEGDAVPVDCWWMPLERDVAGRTDRLILVVGGGPEDTKGEPEP